LHSAFIATMDLSLCHSLVRLVILFNFFLTVTLFATFMICKCYSKGKIGIKKSSLSSASTGTCNKFYSVTILWDETKIY